MSIFNRKQLPLVLAFALATGGCAPAMRFNDVTRALDNCWSVTERVYTKGKGKKAEVVGKETTGRDYSSVCGERMIESERNRTQAEVEIARINASSEMLTVGLAAATDSVLKANILRQIVERLDSENEAVRASQAAANRKAGVSDAYARANAAPRLSAPVQCRMKEKTTGGKTALVFECS